MLNLKVNNSHRYAASLNTTAAAGLYHILPNLFATPSVALVQITVPKIIRYHLARALPLLFLINPFVKHFGSILLKLMNKLQRRTMTVKYVL